MYFVGDRTHTYRWQESYSSGTRGKPNPHLLCMQLNTDLYLCGLREKNGSRAIILKVPLF